MAAVQSINGSALQLILNTGVDAQGNPVLKTRKYSSVKPGATAQGIYDVAIAISSLQKHTLNSIVRQDDSLVENL